MRLLALAARERGTERLEQAVAAYRAALQARPKERAPLAWASAEHNLGIALRYQGERETGTARLEDSVAAFGAALSERARERVPLDWAASYGEQGVAKFDIAGRKQDAASAKAALAQIDAARHRCE